MRTLIYSALKEFIDKKAAAGEPPRILVGEPRFEETGKWTYSSLSTAHIHDEDYTVFQHFKDSETLIIDVGAHFGYSAVSIWTSGSKSAVVSFEPNSAYSQALRSLVELRYGAFDYSLVALGAESKSADFVVPVVNGHAIGSLATTSSKPDIEGMVSNVMNYAKQALNLTSSFSFDVYTFTSPQVRLDDIWPSPSLPLSSKPIVAIKIDTEGTEAEVISGALNTLATYRPLILVENGHRDCVIMRELLSLGYIKARRSKAQLALGRTSDRDLNGFFLHKAKIPDYHDMGLLSDGAIL